MLGLFGGVEHECGGGCVCGDDCCDGALWSIEGFHDIADEAAALRRCWEHPVIDFKCGKY